MNGYAFLDCGGGRRLERFGGVVVSRPAPAAAWPRGLPDGEWRAATLSFEKETGWRGEAPADWSVRFGRAVMVLRPAGAGRTGVFPEHEQVVRRILRRRENASGSAPLRILNLFAHTGLATLLLAAGARAEIAHVDGAAASVRQARENAALSGLADKPVRWLVDDVLAFLRREARRGRRHDILLADPPSFGRGGKGGKSGKTSGEWRLDRDLPELLRLAGALLAPGGFLSLACHSEGWGDGRLSEAVRGTGLFAGIGEESLFLVPETLRGRPLPSGTAVFASRGEEEASA